MKFRISLPRSAAAFVLAASALPVSSPAHSQGQWYPAWTPCKADGSYQNFYPDAQGMIGLGGLLTGSASGSQSAPYSALRRWLYSPTPNTWMSGGSALYNPRHEDGPDAGILADAGNILYYPNGYDDDPVSATSSVSGSVGVDLVAYYKWSPYYDDGTDDPTPTTPAPPPPASTNFLLQTSLVAYYSNGYQATSAAASGMSSSSSASDQYGEQVQVVAPGGPYPYRYGFYWVNDTKTAGGRHLVSVPVSMVGGQGVYAVHLSGTTHAEAVNTLNANQYLGSAFAAGTVNGRVRHDDRAVAITCPEIETSYFKSNDGYSGSPVQAQHYRNPDGSIAVDSAVAWINVPGDPSYPRGWQVNSLPLTANAVDFQDPSYAWSLSGLTIDQAGLELPLRSLSRTANFHLLEPDTNKFPLHCTVRMDVTDSDGAVAANTYGITWHLPYEKTAFLGSVPEKVKLEKLYGPIEEGGFSDVTASEGRDIDISEGCELAGGAAAATGQEDIAAILEIVGKLAKLTDTKYHYAGENIQKGTQNGQDKWDATLVNPEWAANVNNPDLLTHFNAK